MNFRSWEQFAEKILDLKYETKLDETGIKVSPWTIVPNGLTGVVYDLTREEFETQGEKITDRLEQGPLGPWGESSLTLNFQAKTVGSRATWDLAYMRAGRASITADVVGVPGGMSLGPYPWRFTAPSIYIISSVVLTGLVYFNLAIVGLTSKSFSSMTFAAAQDPSWIDRMNLKKSLNWNLGCDPAALVSGGNGIFAYTIESIISTETGGELSTLAYEGSVLDNCTITAMGAFIDYSKEEMNTDTKIKCTLAGKHEFIAGLTIALHSGDSITRHLFKPYGPKVTNTTAMSRVASQLLQLLAVDAGNGLVRTIVAYNKPDDCTVYITWDSIEEYEGMSMCPNDFPSDLIGISGLTLDNFVQVLWSAVLLDLAVNTTYNRLSISGLMSQSLHQHINVTGLGSQEPLGQVDVVLANIKAYGLPLKESQPIQFNAGYLCHKMWWKTPTNLIVDITVATISLFMAYWTILHLVLRFFAIRSSPHGNHCVCPNCSELLQHGSSIFDMHELRSLSGGTVYKSVPTRSQSAPP
ncbi:hypothetical protein BDV93DRAFT_562563 [Ceratobasidium sp. AG-I]|nr:hypothetical protein BDV93DRAFT_562563 [Ceratobasidium sp. AG-I]